MKNIFVHHEPEFSEVFNIFENYIEEGIDLGSAFSVVRNGQVLINLHGGYTDFEKKNQWNADTILNIYSASKGILAMCMTILLDQNLIDLNKSISNYSKKFSHEFHKNIKVKHLLSHQAGLYGWREKMKTKDLYNPDYCINLLANQKPFHDPGEETCYHVTTIGYIIDELIKSITQKSISQFIADELICFSDKLQFYVGAPKIQLSNISNLITASDEYNSKLVKQDKYSNLAMKNPEIPKPDELCRSEDWIFAKIPSSNCHSNALSLAKIYDHFVNTNSEKKIVSEKSLKKALTIESSRMDYVLRLPMKWGATGFIIGGGRLFGDSDNAFGHTGFGGSIAFADPDRRLGIAYTTNTISNKVIGDTRALKLVEKTYDIIKSKNL